jgi:transcriptional regulator with XRE-family HTH domain
MSLWYERLKDFRESLGLSQSKLAKHLGCSQQKVFGIENGKQSMNVEDLQKLAELGLDIHWLATGKGIMQGRESIQAEIKSLIGFLQKFAD